MNTLYKIIRTRTRARITPSTPEDQYIPLWFEEANKLLEELKKENLTETVKELEVIIVFNKGLT